MFRDCSPGPRKSCMPGTEYLVVASKGVGSGHAIVWVDGTGFLVLIVSWISNFFASYGGVPYRTRACIDQNREGLHSAGEPCCEQDVFPGV